MTSTVIATMVVAAALSLVGGLIVYFLKDLKKGQDSIAKSLDKHDVRITVNKDKIAELDNKQGTCKLDCERRFVDSEVFLRETGFVRRGLENVTKSMNRMEGKLTVTENLPQICGEIARQVAKEMKTGVNNG